MKYKYIRLRIIIPTLIFIFATLIIVLFFAGALQKGKTIVYENIEWVEDGFLTPEKIKKDKAEALEFCVNEGSKLIGIPIEELDLKDNLIICCINRNGKVITPKGQDCIKKGDHVIIVTTNVGLHDLSDILRS